MNWAIKAHRVANVRSGVVKIIREFQSGVFDDGVSSLSNFTQNSRFATMHGIIKAHKAPMSDVLEYRKNRKEFVEKLKKHGQKFFGYTINRY